MATLLCAKDFIHSSDVILDSAELLAGAAVEALKQDGDITISMIGAPPVSSAYFNLILRTVVETYGVDALVRLRIDGTSPVLRQVFERSREAVRRLAV